jgi:hypothetical protein
VRGFVQRDGKENRQHPCRCHIEHHDQLHIVTRFWPCLERLVGLNETHGAR